MTSREPWERFTADSDVRVIGEFKNSFGEHFVIYRIGNEDTLYFTGDEVDWQPRERLLGNSDFMFNEEECEHIARILGPIARE